MRVSPFCILPILAIALTAPRGFGQGLAASQSETIIFAHLDNPDPNGQDFGSTTTSDTAENFPYISLSAQNREGGEAMAQAEIGVVSVSTNGNAFAGAQASSVWDDAFTVTGGRGTFEGVFLVDLDGFSHTGAPAGKDVFLMRNELLSYPLGGTIRELYPTVELNNRTSSGPSIQFDHKLCVGCSKFAYGTTYGLRSDVVTLSGSGDTGLGADTWSGQSDWGATLTGIILPEGAVFTAASGQNNQTITHPYQIFRDGVHWKNANDGFFASSKVWIVSSYPGDPDYPCLDRAVFDVGPGSEYTVSFDQDIANKQLFVRDTVHLDLGSQTYSLQDRSQASVIVEKEGFLNLRFGEMTTQGNVLVGRNGTNGGLFVEQGATLTITDADLIVDGPLSSFGMNSSAFVDVRGGAVRLGQAATDNLVIAHATNGSLRAGILNVGERSDATFGIDKNSFVRATSITLGQVAPALGRVDLSDDALLIAADSITVGDQGKGGLFIVGTAKADCVQGVVAAAAGSVGTVDLAGNGQWDVSGDLRVGKLGTAEVLVREHSLVFVAGNLRIGADANTESIMDIENFADLTVGGGITIKSDGQANLRLFDRATASSLQDTTIQNGELAIAKGAVFSAPNVRVRSTGRLLGKGKVIGHVIDEGGLIGPGFSPGVLTIEGDYTQLENGTLEAEVGGILLGDEYDQLDVTGDVSLAGTLVMRFINGFAPHAGDVFAFLHVGGMQTGQFSHIEIENLAPGFQYDLMAANGGLSLRAVTDGEFVPEPAALTVCLIGVVILTIRSCLQRKWMRHWVELKGWN